MWPWQSLQVGRQGQVGSLKQSDHLSRDLGWEQQQEVCGHGTWSEGREALSLAVLGGAQW